MPLSGGGVEGGGVDVEKQGVLGAMPDEAGLVMRVVRATC